MAKLCMEDNIAMTPYSALAAKHEVSMTEISLAWLLAKVTALVVGATKLHHIEGAVKAVNFVLSEEEIVYLVYRKSKNIGGKKDGKADSRKGSTWSVCSEIRTVK